MKNARAIIPPSRGAAENSISLRLRTSAVIHPSSLMLHPFLPARRRR